MSLDYEQQFYNDEIKLIVGTDEAGRGPLLGPVVAGAVILPRDFKCDLIQDSKKLSEKKRKEAYKIIKDNAIAVGVGIVSAQEIDKINIYQAAKKAMILAIQDMNHDFDLVLTDAMPLKGTSYKYIDIIKGDAKAECIAAASIIAKVTRDNMMEELDAKYPHYHIKDHKGYGTKAHMEALEKYGPIPGVHRLTFGPVSKILNQQIKLF